MISLFLDTASYNMIIALYRDYKIIDKIEEQNDNHLSERFLPAVKLLLDKNKIALSQLDEIIVVNGPGSFTGIRIGVTVAKTMAWALKLPIKTISELLVLSTSKSGYVVPFIDARREAVYAGIYHDGISVFHDAYLTIEDLKKQVSLVAPKNEITYVGYEDIIQGMKPVINYDLLGTYFINLKQQNVHEVKPNYLKKTEAEEKLESDDTRS